MNIKSIVLSCITVSAIALFNSCGESTYHSATSETTESAIVDASFTTPFTLISHTDHTECFDASGDTGTCTSTGQDGAYFKNMTYYTGDGTVIDNAIILMWRQTSDSKNNT